MAVQLGIRVKRVHHDVDSDDGQRVLVSRIWPQEFHKTDPRVDIWLKSVTLQKELRQWYQHQPERFNKFAVHY
ncbi:hypothetical protein MUBE_02255 [Mycobacterium uberis]|uniref:DUF488 domain-containing protein n=1 Tax=Mycobacterium uberis TaxID=2162698 RepID=A0A3E1HJV1_9MYCO|nr:DUF488 family protein [Mycobacterium uberis]RFD26706.1 hypothetical protein MUBE_02255 [Mycobacterium uberis]